MENYYISNCGSNLGKCVAAITVERLKLSYIGGSGGIQVSCLESSGANPALVSDKDKAVMLWC